MKFKDVKIGAVVENKKGDRAEVIEIIDYNIARVKFLDDFKCEKCFTIANIIKKAFKNPYTPNVCGVGYFGDGEYIGSNELGKSNRCYETWRDMLRRCYDYSTKDKIKFYTNCAVCEEWHNFQVFAEWFYSTYPFHIESIVFNLDKDLLQQGVENKVYSPETCVWLPSRVNKFLMFIVDNSKIGTTLRKYKDKDYGWWCRITDFNTGNRLHLGLYKTQKEANKVYVENKLIQIENVKLYLKNLKYLKNDIIDLVDGVVRV